MTADEPAGLRALRRVRAQQSAEKLRSVQQEVERAQARGERVTFASVARAAKVSTSFIYAHPELKAIIESQRIGGPRRRVGGAADPNAHTDLLLARGEAAELRSEVALLRRRLGEAIGTVEEDTALDTAAVEGLRSENVRLRAEVRGLEAEVIDLRESLEGLRARYRRMVAATNRK